MGGCFEFDDDDDENALNGIRRILNAVIANCYFKLLKKLDGFVCSRIHSKKV